MASRPKTIELTVAVAAPETDREQRERADGADQRHQEQDDARAAERRDEDRPEPDAVADHATERRDEGADERGRPRHQADRRGEPRPETGDPLDEDRDVRPAHLDGHERDAEDQEDAARRAIGQDAAEAGVGQVDDPAGRDDLRADLA